MSEPVKNEIMEVQLRWEGSIGVLTIHNPSRKNAMSPPVSADLLRHVGTLVHDPKCRAIVLSGSSTCFSAGGDVKAMQGRAAEINDHITRRLRFTTLYHPLLRMMVEGPKPVVTAVEGVAFGGGLSLAIASDHTVAGNNARFCAAQILRGTCPDMGLYYLLAARAGPGRAREILLSGREFSALDAERYAVVHTLTSPGESLAAAMKVAEHYAALPPLAFALTKAAMTHGYQTLEACFQTENNYQPVVSLSRDHKESIAAFMEKRKPVYTGE